VLLFIFNLPFLIIIVVFMPFYVFFMTEVWLSTAAFLFLP